jgi:hypothetical protein
MAEPPWPAMPTMCALSDCARMMAVARVGTPFSAEP